MHASSARAARAAILAAGAASSGARGSAHLDTSGRRLSLVNPKIGPLPSLRFSTGGGGARLPPLPPRSGGGGGGGGGGGAGWASGDSGSSSSNSDGGGIFGALLSGWNSRVAADPQFPFKVLMEELVGVTACVLGDMASRPNFGLNELDFVFSTLVVGSILNFVLMYLLAPTAASNAAVKAASSIPSNMFAPGAYSLTSRMSALVYKGVTFAAVGFAAGLVGTAISNGLIALRKKMDPAFETPNKAPPTLLNAATWALHMGVSSNVRYQVLNGVEYALEKAIPGPIFKASVIGLRCANNVLGGVSFVMLARLTGSQKPEEKVAEGLKEPLVHGSVVVDAEALENGDAEVHQGESK